MLQCWDNKSFVPVQEEQEVKPIRLVSFPRVEWPLWLRSRGGAVVRRLGLGRRRVPGSRGLEWSRITMVCLISEVPLKNTKRSCERSGLRQSGLVSGSVEYVVVLAQVTTSPLRSLALLEVHLEVPCKCHITFRNTSKRQTVN